MRLVHTMSSRTAGMQQGDPVSKKHNQTNKTSSLYSQNPGMRVSMAGAKCLGEKARLFQQLHSEQN